MLRTAICVLVSTWAPLALTLARTKDKPAPDRDNYELVGHVALTGGAVNRLIPTKHFSSSYLYAEQSGGNVSVIDVSDSAHPRTISSVNGRGSLVAVAGDVALVTSETQAPAAAAAKTISIVDFSDKTNPKVTRQFAGVTSIGSDDQRSLVFLVNSEGLWILHRHQAMDPEVMERYAHDVVYNH